MRNTLYSAHRLHAVVCQCGASEERGHRGPGEGGCEADSAHQEAAGVEGGPRVNAVGRVQVLEHVKEDMTAGLIE